MAKLDLKRTVLDWSVAFMRLSMHDFYHYTRDTGLSLGAMIVLLHLHYRGPSEVMGLTELVQISPAGASQLVDRLVSQGLVARTESAEDRRVHLVRLTDEGHRLVEESIQARQNWMEGLLAALSEEEQDNIARSLRLLTERATQLEEQRR